MLGFWPQLRSERDFRNTFLLLVPEWTGALATPIRSSLILEKCEQRNGLCYTFILEFSSSHLLSRYILASHPIISRKDCKIKHWFTMKCLNVILFFKNTAWYRPGFYDLRQKTLSLFPGTGCINKLPSSGPAAICKDNLPIFTSSASSSHLSFSRTLELLASFPCHLLTLFGPIFYIYYFELIWLLSPVC